MHGQYCTQLPKLKVRVRLNSEMHVHRAHCACRLKTNNHTVRPHPLRPEILSQRACRDVLSPFLFTLLMTYVLKLGDQRRRDMVDKAEQGYIATLESV